MRGTGDYKDILIYRSALNRDEIALHLTNTLYKGSLEIYAPLNDASFAVNTEVGNLAQTTSALYIKGKVTRVKKYKYRRGDRP